MNKVLFYLKRVVMVVSIFLLTTGLFKTARAYTIDEQNEEALFGLEKDANQKSQFSPDCWRLKDSIQYIRTKISAIKTTGNYTDSLESILHELKFLSDKATMPDIWHVDRKKIIDSLNQLGVHSGILESSLSAFEHDVNLIPISTETIDLVKHVLLRVEFLKLQDLVSSIACSSGEKTCPEKVTGCSQIDQYLLYLANDLKSAIILPWHKLNYLPQIPPLTAVPESTYLWEQQSAQSLFHSSIPTLCPAANNINLALKRLRRVGCILHPNHPYPYKLP